MTIPEWERDVRTYKKIISIKFFSKYRQWKNFYLWKRLMKRTKMFERTEYLKKELFGADDTLRPTLLAIREVGIQMASRDILQVN